MRVTKAQISAGAARRLANQVSGRAEKALGLFSSFHSSAAGDATAFAQAAHERFLRLGFTDEGDFQRLLRAFYAFGIDFYGDHRAGSLTALENAGSTSDKFYDLHGRRFEFYAIYEACDPDRIASLLHSERDLRAYMSDRIQPERTPEQQQQVMATWQQFLDETKPVQQSGGLAMLAMCYLGVTYWSDPRYAEPCRDSSTFTQALPDLIRARKIDVLELKKSLKDE